MQITNNRSKARPEGLAERIYLQLKDDIFDFHLLPGDRFSENEIAVRMDVSRTPVRQALFWLEREGYVEVHFRSGWQVRPFDFAYFEELYDLRIVLECEAVKRLCARPMGEVPGSWRRLPVFGSTNRGWRREKPSQCTTSSFIWRWSRRRGMEKWRVFTAI